MSKISIAMTTYNGEQFLLEQLDSLLAQTRQPDEVIICDDCSSDRTLQILHQFIQDHHLWNWHVIENQQNIGYLENFRQAMRLTTGDYVFLCDQDDIWHKDKISKMAAILDANQHICALACGYSTINCHNVVISSGKKFYAPAFLKAGAVTPINKGKTLYYNVAQGCAGVYRRNVVTSYCAITECNIIPHDWALNLMAHQSNCLFFLNEELLFYRIHEKNTLGIADSQQVINNRISRLREYSRMMIDASKMPLPNSVQLDLQYIAEFTSHRILWLEKKVFSIWVAGLFKYFPTVRDYFVLEYMKDLVLVLLKKIP